MGGLCYRGFELPGDDYNNKRNELKFNSECLTVNDSFHISLQIIFA